MKFYEAIKGLDQKFSWSFFGTVFSVLFFLFGLYTTFVYQKKPRLQFQTLSEAPVYSLSEDVGKLDILFEGEDIRKKHQTLTILTIRVANIGSADITKSLFDPDSLPTLSFTNCRVIKSELIGASSDYLKSTVQWYQTNGTIAIAPVIIEASEAFDLKFLLLHSDSLKPCYLLTGKIASVPRFETLNVNSPKAQLTFWQRALGGNFLVQVLRILVYALGSLVCIVGGAVFLIMTSEKIKHLRRRRVIRKYKMGADATFGPGDERLFEEYIKNGELAVVRIARMLRDEQGLEEGLKAQKEWEAQGDGENGELILVETSDARVHRHYRPKALRLLTEAKIVTIKDGKIAVDKKVQLNLDQFIWSLTILSPKRLREARGMSGPYGTESTQVQNIDALAGTNAGEPGRKK